MDTYFREVQRFRQPWLCALLILPGLPMLYGAYRQFVVGERWGDRPMSDAGLAAVLAGYVLFVSWFVSLKLVTEVLDREVYVKFVRLWPARRIPLEQIRGVSAVVYRPVRDYGGWGVRIGKKGMAYNVRGNRGVQLELAMGQLVLVGSERAEELARVIENRKALHRPAPWPATPGENLPYFR